MCTKRVLNTQTWRHECLKEGSLKNLSWSCCSVVHKCLLHNMYLRDDRDTFRIRWKHIFNTSRPGFTTESNFESTIVDIIGNIWLEYILFKIHPHIYDSFYGNAYENVVSSLSFYPFPLSCRNDGHDLSTNSTYAYICYISKYHVESMESLGTK